MASILSITSSRRAGDEAGPRFPSSAGGATGRRVAVIGAGAVGVAMVLRLGRMPGIAEIVVVDTSSPGFGLAFGDSDEQLLCNTPAEIMSLDAERPGEFADYLEARFGQTYATDFVPRGWFADYCVDSFNRARASTQARVRQVRALATQISEAGPGYRIHTDTGAYVEATDVVVTAGATIPRIPPGLARYTGLPTMTISPYPVARMLGSVPPGARVLLLGTKLTAVDASLALGARGRIVTMTSPSGRLPAVRTGMFSCTGPSVFDEILTLRADDPRLVTKLMSISVRWIRQATSVPLRHQFAHGSGLQLLREELALADSGRTSWQTLMPAIAETLNVSPWIAELSQPVRQELFQRFHYVITRYLTAMPDTNARRLLALAGQGRIHIADRYPERIQPDGNGWRASWGHRDIHFDHLVCCMGYRTSELAVLGTRCSRDPGEPDGYRINHQLQVHVEGRNEPDRIWLVGQRAGYRVAFGTLLPTNVQQVGLVASAMQAAWSRTNTCESTHAATSAGKWPGHR